MGAVFGLSGRRPDLFALRTVASPRVAPITPGGRLVWAGQKGQSLLSVLSLLVTALNAGPASQSAHVTPDLSLPRNSRWPP